MSYEIHSTPRSYETWENRLLTANREAVGSTLIPLISSESGDESLFPLHPSNDKSILEFWHSTVLPCLKSDAYQGLTAAHLFRFGVTEENSIPTVLMSVDDSSREMILRERISTLFDKPLRSSLRISFEESNIRRTANFSKILLYVEHGILHFKHIRFMVQVLASRIGSTALRP